MSYVPQGLGTADGGGGGLTLGPPTNSFNAATKAAAETARDTYASANAAWLAQYDAEPTYVIILSWPVTPTDTVYQARRSGAWADVTGLVTGPEGGEGPRGPMGEAGTPPTGNASAYSYLVKPSLTNPNVTSDQTIAASGDGYKHTLINEFAGPAGIEVGADFITEWEGSIAVEVANQCNLQLILRTTHKFGTPEKTLVHERPIFHDLVGGVYQTFSMTDFFSRSAPVAGTYRGTEITREDIEGESKITYELEVRSFNRKSETDRNSNTLNAFVGTGMETASYQLRQAVEIGDGFLVDALVFWSPTAQHATADRIRFGDTVTITHDGTDVETKVFNQSRDGHIVTLILEPLGEDTWAAVDTAANPTVADSDGTQFGSWITASEQSDRNDVASAGQWYRAESEAGAGSEVWREIDRIDEVDNTHLTVGERTATTLELRSSTGDDVLVPSATVTEAGLESAADKELLSALPPKWTPGTYGIGTERSWAQKIYRCVVAREVTDTDNPATDTTGWSLGAATDHVGATNLSVGNRTATSLDVQSDTGDNASLPSASRTQAGLASAADKTKLDGVATGAQVNVQSDWNEAQSTAASYIENKPTIPDLTDYRTDTQITAEIAAALAGDGKLIDGGEYDSTQGYAAKTVVYTTGAGAASYLSKAAVTANTEASTAPGTGSAWQTSWVRLGYADGPPNAFVDAGFTGRHLTFSRESGNNPQTLEVPIGTGQLVLEEIGSAAFDVTSVNQYTAESDGETPIDVSDVVDADILTVQVLYAGAESADMHWFTGADMHRSVSAGDTAVGRAVYALVAAGITLRLGIDGDGHLLVSNLGTSQDPMPLTLWRAAGSNAPAGSTRVERIAFQAEAAGNTAFEAQPLATDPVSVPFGDGSPQILTNVSTNDFDLAAGVYVVTSPVNLGNVGQATKLDMLLRNAADDSLIRALSGTRASGANPDYVALNDVVYVPQDTTVNVNVLREGSSFALPAGWYMEFARFGGGVTGFNPGRIGTATFGLDGTATNVQLMDDTTSAPIVCPQEGWVISVTTAPGLGLSGVVVWSLAEDLRRANEDSSLTAALYTNAANEIFFQAAAQDGGATTGNRVILFHSGTLTESSAGAQPVVTPTILEFDVTGDSEVTGADISNKTYSYESRISQSAHVGSARIVGFPGTAANPSNVDELKAITDFFHETGTFQLPANRMLASVNDIYTIRDEVYPIGVPDTTAPTIYQDFRIRRVAPAAQVHFGYVLGGANFAAAAALVDFTTDIGAARAGVAGNYTVSGIPSDSQIYRLYWAVPDSLPQPTGWTIASFTIANSVDTGGQSASIGGEDYTVYVTDAAYDSTSNNITTIAVTTG